MAGVKENEYWAKKLILVLSKMCNPNSDKTYCCLQGHILIFQEKIRFNSDSISSER
jgi:hypothetical protein